MLRRDWLKLVSAAPLASLASGLSARDNYVGRVVRMRDPVNLEFPLSELTSVVTPTELHYVRNHFAVPKLAADDYRLSVCGAVERPVALSLADLAGLGQSERTATLECAGNNRIQLVPVAKGLQWGGGAVSTARWGGIPLAAVLKHAGLKPAAREVLFVGADQGSPPESPGVIPFDRSLPLEKALAEETLLATRMNGQALPALHGAPLRLVVPGWYGMASVKWLKKIIVLEEPHRGYWQTIDYAVYTRPVEGVATLTPVREMQVKAAIARPTFGTPVKVNQPLAVEGAAWGHTAIEKVELTADNGKTWAVARFTSEPEPFTWRLWRATLTPTARGPLTLMVRATDVTGATQPAERDPDRRNYAVNHLIPHELTVV